MMTTLPPYSEKVWTRKADYDHAEKLYYEKLAKLAQLAQVKAPEQSALQNVEEPVIEEEVDEAIRRDGLPKEIITNVIPKRVDFQSLVREPEKVQQEVLPKKVAPVKVKNQAPKPKNQQNDNKKDAPEAVNQLSDNKIQECPAKLQKGFNDTKKHKQHNQEFRNETTPKNKGTNINTIPEIPQNLLKVEDPAPKQNGLVKTESAPQNSGGTHFVTEMIELTIKNKTTSTTTNNKETNNKVKKDRKKKLKKGAPQTVNTLAGEVAKAREHIKNSMQCIDNVTSMTSNLMVSGGANKLQNLETEHNQLKQKVNEMSQVMIKLEQRIAQLEKEIAVKCTISTGSQHSLSPKAPTNTPSKPSKPQDDEADDGVDLFASDSEEEDAEAAKIKEQRLAEYNAKKSKKPVLIAKSNIILDVKPWDDETDMKKMEEEVRSVTTDGLVWGASKLVPLAYGIHKLQISCVVEDDKVSVDWLQETIQEKEDYVQSVDIAAFNKV